MTTRKASRRPVKKVRTTYYDVPTSEAETIDEIQHRLNIARRMFYVADEGSEEYNRAKAQVDKVEAEKAKHFQRLYFRPLSKPSMLNDLMNAHPATPEQIEAAGDDEKPTLDIDSFNVAYLLACITDDLGMTEAEWREWLWDETEWTQADRKELFDQVHVANLVGFHAGIPKG